MEHKIVTAVSVPYSIEKVWEVLQKPQLLDFDGTDSNRTKKTKIITVSDTQWKEKLADGSFSEVNAELDAENKTLKISTENPTHPGEKNYMTLILSEDGENTKIDIESAVETTSKLALMMLKMANKSGKMTEVTNQSVSGAVKKAIEGK